MAKLNSLLETTAEWARQREIPALITNETPSTNDDAKKAALSDNGPLTVYVTGHQTAGRGRGANTWLDTGAGESLLSTWSLAMSKAPQAITGPRLGLATFRAMNAVWPSVNFSLKAPNDILIDGKKVLGLLTEVVSDGRQHRLLIGVGFNVFNHPRAMTEATHLVETLPDGVNEAQWFQFLDKFVEEIKSAAVEVESPELSVSARRQLTAALRANPNSKIDIRDISPQGDIIHASGTISWHDL